MTARRFQAHNPFDIQRQQRSHLNAVSCQPTCAPCQHPVALLAIKIHTTEPESLSTPYLFCICLPFLSAITVPSNEILEVRLSRNQIGGPLPAWLASMSVILLDVSYNKLGGSLPAAALGSNLVLQELLLAGNQFSGSLSADMLRYAGAVVGACKVQ
jgi:hypothetical protein